MLERGGDAVDVFSAANARIVDEAAELARSAHAELIAAIVWDGVPRGPDDLTAQFARTARGRGVAVWRCGGVAVWRSKR